MKIAVTGGTGFIGKHVVAALVARGDHVTVVSRGAATGDVPAGRGAAARQVGWDALAGAAGAEVLSGLDAVVHLAGAPAVGGAWTPAVKRGIRDSRIATTAALVAAMERAAPRPATFVCASAVGYYGPRAGDVELDESEPPGGDFLATVCRDWEVEADRAAAHGVRVVRARIGIVLGPGGGALAELVRPFRLYAGGPIGSGRQVVSWIHVEDVVRAVLASIDEPRLTGPLNVTAPHPVTNAELARELGRVLRRPAWLPVPAAALRLRFGEGATPLLTGQRVVPRRLQAAGFVFRFPLLAEALADLLGS